MLEQQAGVSSVEVNTEKWCENRESAVERSGSWKLSNETSDWLSMAFGCGSRDQDPGSAHAPREWGEHVREGH